MQNFKRVVGTALRQRSTVVVVLASSLCVAALWGANLGLVKPLVEIVFSGEKPHDWFRNSLAKSEARQTELRERIATIEKKPDAEQEPWSREKDIGRLRFELTSEEQTHRGLDAVYPYVLKYCPNDSFQALMLVVGILLIATFIKDGFLVLNQIMVDRLAQQATFKLRKEFFRRTLRLDPAAFSEESTAKLTARFTNDMGQLHFGLVTLFGKCFLEPFKMAACLIGAALICWRLLLLSLVVTPIAAFLIQRLSKSLKRASRRALEDMSQMFGALSETFGGILAVKAFTMERRERRRFHLMTKNHYRRTMKITVYSALSRPGMEFVGMSIICSAIIAGGYLVLNGQTHLFGIRICNQPLDMSSMIAFFALLAGAADPARKLSEVFNALQSGIAASDRIFQAFDREPTIKDPPHPKPLPSPFREIAFDRVDFHYVAGTPVLKEVSLRIPFGETLAIVGPNGCGKSTLAGLLLRFYDPISGCVRIDDVDLREARMRELREGIGFVNQQTQLFDDTILENIRYGSPRATDSEVIEAAKKALAHKFILEKLDAGYETQVGEKGSKLSGGQRQRIALARAILRDPKLLILDEATSQVDVESEQMIHKVLEQFRRGRTTILITHRMATLDLADRIVVMDHGRIVDIGRLPELTQRCELFRRLYQIGVRESA